MQNQYNPKATMAPDTPIPFQNTEFENAKRTAIELMVYPVPHLKYPIRPHIHNNADDASPETRITNHEEINAVTTTDSP